MTNAGAEQEGPPNTVHFRHYHLDPLLGEIVEDDIRVEQQPLGDNGLIERAEAHSRFLNGETPDASTVWSVRPERSSQPRVSQTGRGIFPNTDGSPVAGGQEDQPGPTTPTSQPNIPGTLPSILGIHHIGPIPGRGRGT